MNYKIAIRKALAGYQPVTADPSDRIAAAVLVPFFERDGELFLLFTKRTHDVQHHRGEICFPGGARDLTDPDLLATALREMQEELSIEPNQIEILGKLDEIRTVSSSFIVVPYVGYLTAPFAYRPNPAEVDQVLEIPVRELRNPAIFRQEPRLIDREILPVYYYQWQNHTIWGLTGRILKQLLEMAPDTAR